MSEYQYYEFQAIDRPLTEREMGEMRSYSTRATITPTRFVNHYEWGSFKGNSAAWVEEYFDAFLYVANWGTRELSLRLPQQVLDLKTAKQYCCGEAASARIKGDFIILEFLSEEEGDEWEEGSGWLSSLIPLRADIARGDHRALYLAWLLCAQARELDEDSASPPIPAGLDNLTASLDALADFLHIDSNLITMAAARSPQVDAPPSESEVERWIEALPDDAKTDWLVRFAAGREPLLQAELMRRCRESRSITPAGGCEASITVGELLSAAERLAEESRRKEAERMAAERERREREAAEARDRYLSGLAQREAEAWREVDVLIATKQPGRYDEAVKLLLDLRDLSLREGRAEEVEARLLRLREEHARKPSFIERLKKVRLGA